MIRICRFLLCSVLAILFVAAPVAAQETPILDREWTTIEGDDLPEFLVVQALFMRALMMSRQSLDVREKFLKELGIKPDSPLEEFFMETVVEAKLIIEMQTIDSNLEDEEFMEHQYAGLRKKARKLGVVFQALLDGMADAGISTEKLKTYCDDKIKSTLKNWSSDAEEFRLFVEAVSEFDKQLVER